MSKTFVLSDGSINSYGFAIDMSKLKLSRFEKNPVMLYNHRELVGKWANLKLEDGKLIGEPVFMSDEGEDVALKVSKRVENGFVNGASLGIIILGVSEKKGEAPLVEAEVFECSVCDIPSNENAIALYSKEGVKLEGSELQLTLEGLQSKKQPLNMKLNSKSYLSLGLSEGADAAAIDAAIEAKDSLIDGLKAQLKAVNDQKITDLIASATKKGLTQDQIDKVKKIAEKDLELASDFVESLPGKKTLSGQEKPDANDSGDRSDWNFEKWRKEDTAGLLSIKTNDPERYQKIISKS